MAGGAKPGERRGGRRVAGIKNKKTIAADLRLSAGGLSAMSPKDAFDVLQQMETIAKMHLGRAAAEQKKGDKADQKVIDAYLAKALSALDKLAPYKAPRLSAIKVEDGRPDLTRLPANDLAFLRKVVDKLEG